MKTNYGVKDLTTAVCEVYNNMIERGDYKPAGYAKKKKSEAKAEGDTKILAFLTKFLDRQGPSQPPRLNGGSKGKPIEDCDSKRRRTRFTVMERISGGAHTTKIGMEVLVHFTYVTHLKIMMNGPRIGRHIQEKCGKK